MPEKKVRVRYAPSPTGPLHLGGVRTALYNYLFAKKNHGEFILRIEDTDQTRFVPGAIEYIVDSFRWCGLKFDEGYTIGGAFGPYIQSERKHLYKQFASRLLEDGHAYYAFDTPAELDEIRKKLESEKAAPFQYDSSTRMGMKNSLTMPKEDVEKLLNSNVPYVIRIKINPNEIVKIQDLIRGEVLMNSSLLDDKVLFKSDGMPTYHLANVVDDYLMHISHVIRGEEWLPSTPLHFLLYKYLGWEKEMPIFAHLPLILKPDGKGKLSKRDGDRLGIPVFPLQWKDPETGEVSKGYQDAGYFPEAFINMLALLGWNPGSEQEIFTLEELVQAFDLNKVHKSGAKFDVEKAKWFNHQFLLRKKDIELLEDFKKILVEKNISSENEYILKVIHLIKDRVHFVPEFWAQSSFFFVDPPQYDAAAIKKFWKANTNTVLEEMKNFIQELRPFELSHIENSIKELIHQKEWNMGMVMNSLRICFVGASTGPGVFQIMELIGKENCLSRIQKALSEIKI